MKFCRMCGKDMRGEGDICRACEELVRAEAAGRQRERSGGLHKAFERVDIRSRKAKIKGAKEYPSREQEEGTAKKPHHFKSMAEYLEYLKGKK